MGTFQVYFPGPPSGLFGPGNCTLRVIWDGHNTPGYFSGPHSGLFGPGNSTSTLRVIWDVHPLGCTLRVIWAGHPLTLQAILTELLCPRHDHPIRVIWGLTTLWANAPSRLFGPGYPLAWIICRVILGSAASASQCTYLGGYRFIYGILCTIYVH